MTVSLANEQKMHLKRWIVLLISPVVWTLSFGIIYLLNEAVCGLHFWRRFVWDEITAVIPVMLLILLLTLGVTIGNAWFGWKMWRKASLAAQDEAAAERDRFIGAAGMMMGGLFAVLTGGLTVVVLWLQPC
jgi:hypothetical protein